MSTIAVPVLTALVVACMTCGPSEGRAFAQSPDAGQAVGLSAAVQVPTWDVVSVHPAQPQSCTQSGIRTNTNGVNVVCGSLLLVIRLAYGVMDPNRVVGAPDWMKSGGLWNIDAKVAGEDVAAYGKLSPDDQNRMLRTLLADRFHLKAHMEKREMPAYDLVVAKGGPKLREAMAGKDANANLVGGPGGKIEGVGTHLTSLPSLLNREVGRPVVDKTGLTGKYDFTLEYVPAAKAATDETGGPSIFTAVEEQLGLKLEPAKEPMDVLVIDSIEQPAAN